MESSAQRFGGPWTVIKLDAVAAYLTAFTTALKKQTFTTLYIDAFAGSGRCNVDSHHGPTLIAGSAARALGVTPSFDRLVFIEKSSRRCAALRQLASSHHLQPDVEVLYGDANACLPKIIGSQTWASTRAVAFLDPFGLRVDWNMLDLIAKTEAVDIWYLFPLGGVVRQAAIDSTRIDSDKQLRLTQILGTERWRSDWYRPSRQTGLFGDDADVRHLDWSEILDWVTTQLRTIFPAVVKPLVLTNPANNAPLYALYFAISNSSPRAIGLATRMASHILDRAG